MKIFALIVLCFLSFSCGSSGGNTPDEPEGNHGGDAESDEAVCAEHYAECGKLRIAEDDSVVTVFCGECEEGFKCKEEENRCTAATRVSECRGKPGHGVWNDDGAEGTFIQTLEGDEWIPKSKEAVYSETPVECGFICEEDYYWNNFYCIDRPTRKEHCPALPGNAVWNDNGAEGMFIQTWDGENWVPDSRETVPGKTPGECVFVCEEGYALENGRCITAPTRTAPCKGLPEHASWNKAESILQTSDGFDWTPTDEGVYDEAPSTVECRFVCNDTYFWSGSKCINPCESSPCLKTENSDGVCTPADYNLFICGCKTGFRWNSKQKQCESNENAGKVVCTGQTQCYIDNAERPCDEAQGDYFGQDAQYAAQGLCIPLSFSANDPESDEAVVTDSNTGLQWQRTIPSEHDFTWEKANNYCKELEYAGHDDWQLPTIYELRTIVNYGKGGIDHDFFPGMRYIDFWTSTVDAVYGNGKHWFVDDRGGYGNNGNSLGCGVRCVRKSWSAPVSKFHLVTENGGKIVRDSVTGLIWQGIVDDLDQTWDEARIYCENMVYAGYNDWRLPNIRELETLLDFEESEEPPSSFPNIPNWRFWSSTTYDLNSNSAWFLNLEYGGSVVDREKTAKFLVLCVR